MRKLKFLGLFIAAGLLMQSAYAACSNPAGQTGQQVCMVVGALTSDMFVYTCQSNRTWVKTGVQCDCPNAYKSVNGQWTCVGAYTTS